MISAHQFPQVYKTLGIDLAKLGCVMLYLAPFDNAYSIEQDGAGVSLYYAKNKDRFWINGWVFNNPHVTLLYGLLSPAYENPTKDLVTQVLMNWPLPSVIVDRVGYFDSPYPDEPYYCVVAHIKVTPELLEGHQRLCLLPHVMTFPHYRPHATIAYINKEQGEAYRDRMIQQFNDLWAGRSLSPLAINFGSAK